MDKATRGAIESATQRARSLLEKDFADQLDADFDVREDGTISAKAGGHLTPRQAFQRERIVASIEHKRAAGMSPAEAVADYLRDAAFTTLNRFVALKMLEARELVQECISKGEQSAGYREFCGLAPALGLLPDSAGYRLYIESVFDELSTEVKVLFDRRDPSSVLWPRRAIFDELLQVLNGALLAGVWGEDETIGWVYQYFNGQAERRQMREESQAPRNSRELAVRNQFFTPRYVVQFLTDNTLGRIWYEMRGTRTILAQRCEYMVRRSIELPIQADAIGGEMPAWLSAVAAGDFSHIPEPFTWAESSAMAHLIDGFALAPLLGLGDCGDIANRKAEEAERNGAWSGTAAELWLCLFFEHRRWRHYGQEPQGVALEGLNALCTALRRSLTGEEHPRFSVFRQRQRKDPRDLRVLDPACGSGHFLLYAFDLLLLIYEEAYSDPDSPKSEATGRTLVEDYASIEELRRALPSLILAHNLHGVDIDPRCAQIAQLALWMRAQRAYRDLGIGRSERPMIRRSNIVVAEPIACADETIDQLTRSVHPPVLGDLLRELCSATTLAGDLGVLLRLEQTLAGGLAKARRQFADRQKELAKGFLPGLEPPTRQGELDLSGVRDDSVFFDAAERIRRALEDTTGKPSPRTEHRLFADDATQGLGLLGLVEKKFDVVLMNPPFGAGSTRAKVYFEKSYPRTKNDVYAAFVERGIELLSRRGRLGAITSRTGFFLSSFQRWREEVVLKESPPVVVADLGVGVLDSAMVEVAAYCLEKIATTVASEACHDSY